MTQLAHVTDQFASIECVSSNNTERSGQLSATMSSQSSNEFHVAIVGTFFPSTQQSNERVYHRLTRHRSRHRRPSTSNGPAQEKHLLHALRRSIRVLGSGVGDSHPFSVAPHHVSRILITSKSGYRIRAQRHASDRCHRTEISTHV